jgi:hypothetical protein
MQIKTSEGEKSVASAGVGGTALGLGIAGTVGLLNQLGNGGLLGGLFNGSCGNGCGNVTHDTRVIASLESQLAKEKAERYADYGDIATFKEAKLMAEKNDEKIQANYIELAKAVAASDKQVAVDKQATQDNFAFLNHRIDEKYREIKCYVDGTFVPGKLVMPLSSVCPEAMQRYNSWTAPTTETSTGA